MSKVKYQIIESDGEFTIRTEDGGAAYIYNNGEHLLTEYYQDRCTKPEIDWDTLSEGKMYIKDWEEKQESDDEVIQDALEWLHFCQEGFLKMDLLFAPEEKVNTPEEKVS